VKKLAGWAVLAFLLFYVLRDPAAAASTAHHLIVMLADVGAAAGRFLSDLTTGGTR
jgi:hypothetical protein